MKMLVVGNRGQLGSDLMLAASSAGHEALGIDFPEIDITVSTGVCEAVERIRPDVVLNCAAFTAVDKCEQDAKTAYAVNAEGAGNLAAAAEKIGVPLVHISTDYVFDGTKKTPYVETDSPHPLSVYGKSKLAGEQLVTQACSRSFIFRIAWLYGTRGANFLKTIRDKAQKLAVTGEPLKVVSDQRGTPTYTMHVCRQVLSIIRSGSFGLYHCTNEGACSWFDFAKAIIGAYGIDAVVEPCTTAEFPRPAPRPANSVLENARLNKMGQNSMPAWEMGLAEYLAEERMTPSEAARTRQ